MLIGTDAEDGLEWGLINTIAKRFDMACSMYGNGQHAHTPQE